jgi:hypothetical protein
MGILSFIKGVVNDITDIPGDVVDHFEKMMKGPGGVVGILVAGGTVFVGVPGNITTAVVAGVAAGAITEALVKTRTMSAEEHTLAQMVFGNSLPPRDKIILSNIEGKDGRQFVIPNLAGESIINLGSAYEDPIRHTNNKYREHGQILIHELTHVWQIEHTSSVMNFLCEAIHTQVANPVYEPAADNRPWGEYNPEQQATIVDRWYAGFSNGGPPCSIINPFYHYVLDTINGGNPPPAVQTLSVRDVARSKFGEDYNFSIKSRFPNLSTIPLGKSKSLLKGLIGLRG